MNQLKPCPKCNQIISYNLYFHTYFCPYCGYYEDQAIIETQDAPILTQMTKDEIAEEIYKALNK